MWHVRQVSIGLACAALALCLALSGCSGTPSAPTKPQSGDGATPHASGRGAACSSSPSTEVTSWAPYHDAVGAFTIATPPGWRTGAFAMGGIDATPQAAFDLHSANLSTYIVDFFPPGSPGVASATGKMRQDLVSPAIHIEAEVDASTRFEPSLHAQYHPSATPVCVGGQFVPVYTYTSPTGGTLRETVVTPGRDGIPYAFILVTQGSQVSSDTQLYMEMLQSFTYTGAQA